MQSFSKTLLVFSLLALFVCASAAPSAGTTGYVESTKYPGGKLFWWFFESKSGNADDPLVIWLNGGPGCSSSLGEATENGPFAISMETGEVSENPFAWNKNANVLYIDQPFGVGFSVASSVAIIDEAEVAAELTMFLAKWYSTTAPGQKVQNNDLYIAGESFGGHYIPAFSQALVDASIPGSANLKGVLIGDGYIDPIAMYRSYLPYLLSKSLVSNTQAKFLKRMENRCIDLFEQKDPNPAIRFCQMYFGELAKASGNVNIYDVSKPCADSGLCYDFSKVVATLREVGRTTLNATDSSSFEICNNDVGMRWSPADLAKSFSSSVRDVLAHKIPVILYHGDLDLICNWMGGLATAENIDPVITNAPLKLWSPSSEQVEDDEAHPIASPAGWYKTSGLLTFLRVHGAGHMVPTDQPQHALAMLTEFIANKRLE